jgi:hypothetical protein
MNTTNEQDSEHDDQKKLIGHLPRRTARPVDARLDSYVEPETLPPAPVGTGLTTEDDTVGEVPQPRVDVIEYCRELLAPDGNGTIEHPKCWLEELEIVKHRKTNGLSVPKGWEPFMEDVDGETSAENGSPPNTNDTSETEEDA